jgi:hypothetical protein
VEAPVGWALVLHPAGGAHRETHHGRALPVVRGARDDRQPRPAVGAIEKGVQIPPVSGIEQFGEALLAGRDIGCDKNSISRTVLAGFDAKLVFPSSRLPFPGQAVDPCEWRRPGGKFAEERVQGMNVPLHFDQDTSGLVLDEAAEPQARSKPVHKGSKADALDDSADDYRPAFHDDAP